MVEQGQLMWKCYLIQRKRHKVSVFTWIVQESLDFRKEQMVALGLCHVDLKCKDFSVAPLLTLWRFMICGFHILHGGTARSGKGWCEVFISFPVISFLRGLGLDSRAIQNGR